MRENPLFSLKIHYNKDSIKERFSMNSSIQSNENDKIPNSPSELIQLNEKEKEFSLEEIENLIKKLSYEDEDNLIFHLIQKSIRFHLYLLKKSREEDSDLNPLQISSDLTKLKIIKNLYEEI